LAFLEDGGLEYVRAVGNLSELKRAAKKNGSEASTGLGHTRWATHGRVCEENAHPLAGCEDREVAVVLNGIVENFRELKESVEEGDIVAVTPQGATFYDVEGTVLERDEVDVTWDLEAAEKQGYETFMLKEIYEQPDGVAETIGDRVRHGRLVLDSLGMTEEEI